MKFLLTFISTTFLFALLAQQNYTKTGRIPHNSPFRSRSIGVFMPYNPIVVQIGTEMDGMTKELIKLREKAVVYSFQSDPQKFNQLAQETQEFDNIHIYPFSFENANDLSLQDWCKDHDLSQIELIYLNAPGKETQIIYSTQDLVSRAIGFYLVLHDQNNPPQAKTENPQQVLENMGFILLSSWVDSSGKGLALFLKDTYYKAVFERRFI